MSYTHISSTYAIPGIFYQHIRSHNHLAEFDVINWQNIKGIFTCSVFNHLQKVTLCFTDLMLSATAIVNLG